MRERLRELIKRELQKDILRKNIVAVLKEMSGGGHECDVLNEIGDRLKEQFTPADMSTLLGWRVRWETNAH